jgi:hypothetical protein
MLPSTTPLLQLEQYLIRYLGYQQSTHDQTLLVKNVLKSLVLQERAEMVELYRRRILVDDSVVCAVCGKRMGATSAFIAEQVLHGGRGRQILMHFGCRPAHMRSSERDGTNR